MASEVFCKACADTGVLPRGAYAGEQEHYAGEQDCDQCPVCPCGDPFSMHSIEPSQIVRGFGEFWASDCLNDFYKGMQEAINGTL